MAKEKKKEVEVTEEEIEETEQVENENDSKETDSIESNPEETANINSKDEEEKIEEESNDQTETEADDKTDDTDDKEEDIQEITHNLTIKINRGKIKKVTNWLKKHKDFLIILLIVMILQGSFSGFGHGFGIGMRTFFFEIIPSLIGAALVTFIYRKIMNSDIFTEGGQEKVNEAIKEAKEFSSDGPAYSSNPISMKNYGFSYIKLFRVLNLAISIIVGFITMRIISESHSLFVAIMIGLAVAVVFITVVNAVIVLFTNISIIARNSTEILEVLKKRDKKDQD